MCVLSYRTSAPIFLAFLPYRDDSQKNVTTKSLFKNYIKCVTQTVDYQLKSGVF